MALKEYWPEVINSLQEDVLPWYVPKMMPTESGFVRVIESWTKVKADPTRNEMVSKLEAWAERFLITEDWIFDAAVDTLLIYCPEVGTPGLRKEDWFWRYTPRGFHPSFEPAFTKNFWYPPRTGWPESWDQFRKRMDGEFRRQLAAYRAMIESRLGIGREKRIRTEAAWTARFQKGESVAAIFQTVDIANLSDPEQTIYRAIERFAKSIGLRLRKRGTRPKRTSVQPRP